MAELEPTEQAPKQEEVPKQDGKSFFKDLWGNTWGRTLVVSATIAVTAWALRETAAVTTPVIDAARGVVLPLAIGFTIAYVLTPVVDFFEHRRVPRLVGTTLMYTVFTLILVGIVMFVAPAVVRESTDLAVRSVQDTHFVDLDNNGRFSRGDRRLLPVRDQPGWFVEDQNGNARIDPGERRYSPDDTRIIRDPALVTKVAEWANRQASSFRQWAGLDLGEQALKRLAFYQTEVSEDLTLLDASLEFANQGASLESMPAGLRTVELHIDTAHAPLAWPGVARPRIEAAAQNLSEADRSIWLTAIQQLVDNLNRKHQTLLGAFERIDGGNGEETATAQRLRVALTGDLDEESERRVEQFVARLRQARDSELAQEIFERVGTSPDTSNSFFLQSIVKKADEEATLGMAGISTMATNAIKGILGNITQVFTITLDLVLIPIYAFFLTLAMPRLRASLKALVPLKGRNRTLKIMHAIERVVAAFFRGRLIVCTICGILFYIGFAALQVPYAAMFAFFIGAATTVPLAGLVFLVPAVLLMVVDGGDAVLMRTVLVVGVYSLIQTLEATVFTPTVMGKEVELHPVILIIALVFFGRLWGILGLILAVPAAATMRILLREFLLPRLGKPAPATTRALLKGSKTAPESPPS